jgi:peptidoglycan/LPS O-acetylase OafA/YrhL
LSLDKAESETLRVSEDDISDTQPPRRMLRSIGAVVAGLIAVIILSIGTDMVMHATKVFPPWGERMTDSLFVLATAYRCIYAVAGSYIAARLARDRPMKHALVLGVIGLAVSVVGLVATWNAGPELGPRWYPLALVVTALPCAWLGGKLRDIQLHPR